MNSLHFNFHARNLNGHYCKRIQRHFFKVLCNFNKTINYLFIKLKHYKSNTFAVYFSFTLNLKLRKVIIYLKVLN